MSTLDWLKEYDAELFLQVTNIIGSQPSSHYDDSFLSRLKVLGITGFYFHTIDGKSDNAPEWLPKNDKLATMILRGKATRTSTNLIAPIYETALNAIVKDGHMHTILYFKDAQIEFQSLFSLGNLNKHRAMGAQAIVGSPTTGFLKAVTEFVSRFAGRDDIFQLDKGVWADGLAAIEKHIRTTSVINS